MDLPFPRFVDGPFEATPPADIPDNPPFMRFGDFVDTPIGFTTIDLDSGEGILLPSRGPITPINISEVSPANDSVVVVSPPNLLVPTTGEALDVYFLADNTGSMGGEISMV